MLHYIGIKKDYGRYLVQNRFLIMMFACAFVIIYLTILFHLLPLLTEGNITIGTTISLVGVFIGTYIAMWLINQKRIKTIEENYFYKLEILLSIKSTLRTVDEFNNKVKNMTDTEKTETGNATQRLYGVLFSRYERLIISVNSNTFVPVNIRTGIEALLLIYGVITASLNTPQVSFIALKSNLEIRRDIFDSKYFTADNDELVQKRLKELKDELSKIEQ